MPPGSLLMYSSPSPYMAMTARARTDPLPVRPAGRSGSAGSRRGRRFASLPATASSSSISASTMRPYDRVIVFVIVALSPDTLYVTDDESLSSSTIVPPDTDLLK